MAGTVPFLIYVIIRMLVNFLYSVPVNTQDPGLLCVPEIKLRKNTLYKASREHQLNISCPVTYCQEVPVVKWIKFDNTTKFTQTKAAQVTITKEQTGLKKIISYLIFRNISPDDNGIYRCTIFTSNFSSESHSITVLVLDSINHTKTNNTTGAPQEKETEVRRLLYVFICLGILGLVLIVMLISFLCINLYSRNSLRNKNATLCSQPLNTTTSGKSQEIPEEQNNIYDATPDDLQAEPDSLYTGNNQECTPTISDGNRISDGSQQIIYASLQHPTPREPSAVRHQSRDQLSEYASIRIS